MPEITIATRKNQDNLSCFRDNEWERVFQAVENGEREVFVLVAGCEIYGYATLNYAPKYALYKRLNIPEIQDVYITPKQRRQGYAHKLIDYCELRAKEKGAAQIGISVSVSPEFGIAQQIYIARGYNVDGNGVAYDRNPVTAGQQYTVDENLCLMMLKALL
jgi:GNAT superfamily N-acetyltransferase|tara:strand:+ start:66854 stop:67336 length:483 start_codon:yes stop_codon:yes gene_type:complete